METHKIKLLFIKAARERFAQSFEPQEIEKLCISSVTKPVIKEILTTQLQDADKAKKIKNITALSNSITIKDVEEAVSCYPKLKEEQILRFFYSSANVSGGMEISGGYITRPYLISLVEILEDYTGFHLMDDTSAPLAYLEQKCNDITILDIAAFFSGKENAKLRTLIKNMQKAKEIQQQVSA